MAGGPRGAPGLLKKIDEKLLYISL